MKAKILIIIAALCFSLCSCGFESKEIETRLVCDALAIDIADDGVLVSALCLSAQGEQQDKMQSRVIIEARGENLKDAFESLETASGNNILVEKAGAVVFSKKATGIFYKLMRELFDYERSRINLRLYVCETSPSELLLKKLFSGADFSQSAQKVYETAQLSDNRYFSFCRQLDSCGYFGTLPILYAESVESPDLEETQYKLKCTRSMTLLSNRHIGTIYEIENQIC